MKKEIQKEMWQISSNEQKVIPQEKYEGILSRQNKYLLSLFDQKISKLPCQTIFQSYSPLNKSHYIGQFKIKNGKRLKHGLGKLTLPDQFIYIGQWANNSKQGNGIQIDYDGNRYEGEFSLDQKNGFGIQKLVNGNKYSGQWRNNLKHGKATQIYAISKQIYQGNFQAGKKQGKGKTIYRSGDLFEGHWKNNLKSGNGIVIFYNGDIFKGQWSNNLSQGRCSIYYKSGDHFIGQYENGKRKGFGTYIFSSEQKIQGDWSGDHDCVGKLFYTNGEIYEGQLLKGQRHGWGKYLYQDGDIYQGQWVNGEKSGYGQYSSASIKQFAGIWSHDHQLYGQYQNLTQSRPDLIRSTPTIIKDHLQKPFNNQYDDFTTPKGAKGRRQFFKSECQASTQ